MKKLYKGLIVLFLLLALVLGLSACKEEPAQQQEHEHTFSSEWTTNDTYHWHAATCEHTEQKADRAKHKWVTKITVEATHTTAGEKVSTCSVCGLKKTEIIPAETQVHAYATTWEHDENYHWHPTTCGHDAKGSFEPHTWDTVEVLTPATCEAEGTAQYTCKCGATKTEPIPRHTFATTWTSDDDYHWHAATCGHDAVSGKEEHSWGSYKNNGNGTATYTCSVCGKQVTKTLPTVISMVNTGPGEDASKGVVISWHSTTTGSYLEYTDANSDSFVNTVSNSLCHETLSTANWRDTSGNKLASSHYVCKVYLNDLTPDSTYKYRIRQGGTYSDVATFRTAEADTTYFQFMWMSDNHVPEGGTTTLERVRELINFAQAKNGVDLDFVLFTGDMVNKGQIYEHWKYWSDSGLMNDITYAFVCGNHDYYGWNDKERTTNDYYKEFAAYPANSTTAGKSVLDSSYWFIWNRVLFVCIDDFTMESSVLQNLAGGRLADQQAWFKAVVEANEGKYDYLIFAQHLPWFNTDTAPCDYGYYTSWRKIFDTYKVDFALSSDEHTYRRTYPLYNNVKTDLVDGKVSTGTVYVTSNQTQGSTIDSLSNEAAEDLKYVQYTAGGVGGVYFTVTPTEMTLHLIGSGGKQYDSITVMKKDRSN